jgi:hypothetical protein
MFTILVLGVVADGANGASFRAPQVALLPQLKGDSPVDFNREWKAPLIGQMEELAHFLNSPEERSRAVLNGVGATLPWAQVLMAKTKKEPIADDQKALFKKFDANKDGNLSAKKNSHRRSSLSSSRHAIFSSNPIVMGIRQPSRNQNSSTSRRTSLPSSAKPTVTKTAPFL